MKKNMILTESDLANVIKRVITETATMEEWISRYDGYDDVVDKIQEINRTIKRLMFEKDKLMKQISDLPSITLNVIVPGPDNEKGVKFTHIRGTMYFNYAGQKLRSSIYVGPIEDFPNGINDEKAKRIAREKAYMVLSKKYPELLD